MSLKPNFSTSLHRDISNAALIEQSVRSGVGELSKDGSLVVKTGKHTGRSANDKYVVMDEQTRETVWWDNNVNQMSKKTFDRLYKKIEGYLNEQECLFETNRSLGAIDQHSLNVTLWTPSAHHALFSNHMFRPHVEAENYGDYTILHAPELELDPEEFELKSPTVIVTSFADKCTLIAGTRYAGEIKKSMFSILNFILPEKGVLPMHAGANQRETEEKETSIFFGLSGTGKTTLSTDIGTQLIGDDEHGLSDEGIFNFEGGCYAKTYKLSHETEPYIYEASNRFGALLENVVVDSTTREADFFDKTLTENGRSSYPLNFIDERVESSTGRVPNNIFFLTADAFGVLPPVAKLDDQQTQEYFVLGYTSKLAGTEIGLTEPKATFSPCFGGPFMLRHPSEYAKLLLQYVKRHNINVWLVNTGWTGGAYGEGERFPLHITRDIIRKVQSGATNGINFALDEIFGLKIPEQIEGVDEKFLHPWKGWSEPAAYQDAARKLKSRFDDKANEFGMR